MGNDYVNKDDLYKYGARNLEEEMVILKKKLKEEYKAGYKTKYLADKYRVAELSITNLVKDIVPKARINTVWAGQDETVRKLVNQGKLLIDRQKGSDCYNSILDEDTVLEIRASLAIGIKGCVIAKHVGVSNNIISSIKTGKSWRHVKL